jgi:trehalose synthase
MPSVPVPPRKLDDFIEILGEEAVERVRDAAATLDGARMLHVNSTAYGGGVAELLLTQVALLNELGVDTTWQVIEGTDAFFSVTKFAHNGLQGSIVPWTEDMTRVYEAQCEVNAAGLGEGFDFVIIHDPQPAGVLSVVDREGRRKGKWVWRCHLDLSETYAPVWNYFAGHAARYDAAVFTMSDFVPEGFSGPQIFIIPPSIDPLSAKNQWMDPDTVYEVLHHFGVQWNRPTITQVSRFDPAKDPLGVIDAYRLVKREVPDVQLVMIASMAHDDPEGWHYLEVTQRHRAGDPDIYLLSNVQGVGNLEVNAFQREAAVVLQKSLREGFGLTVSEAMWKGTPVVGGNVGGIRLQIENGVNGYLVDTVEECADRVLRLLGDPDERVRMGKLGHNRVKERFLTFREIEDMLSMLASLR